jgi:adenylate cyclase
VRDAARDECHWREIDLVRVVGRDQPVRLFTPERVAPPVGFAQALASYRAGDFDKAYAQFAALADGDPIAAAFAERLRGRREAGPPQAWDGITNLESK